MKQTVTKRCQSPNLWPLAALLLAQPCYGTSGVALFVDSFVVIATDAKRVNKFGGKATSFSNQCKILTANDRVAVASGLTEEEGVHFDARKILSDAMEESQSLYEAADMAASEMQRDLPAALGDFRKNNPDEFQELLSGSLQILIAGISREGEVEVARRSIPYDKCPDRSRQRTLQQVKIILGLPPSENHPQSTKK